MSTVLKIVQNDKFSPVNKNLNKRDYSLEKKKVAIKVKGKFEIFNFEVRGSMENYEVGGRKSGKL